jgi:DNA repair protein RecO (recombination protein O)
VPLRENEAFVLGSHPLGEADRIVTFLTRSSGKVRGVAKGARRSRRRFGSSLELLSRVRLSYFESERSDLARIEGTDLLESFYRLQEDPERGAAMACLAEIADGFAREQQEDEPLFRLLHATLRAIRDELPLDLALRYFEVWTLRLHGVLPSLSRCASCGSDLAERGGRYDRRESVVSCRGCLAGRGPGDIDLPAASLGAAAAMMGRAPADLRDRRFAPEALRPLGILAQAVFFDLTERRFRSYEVLRQLRRGQNG